MTKSDFLRLASDKYDAWISSQTDQQSGHEYESSFDTFWQDLGGILFQSSVDNMPLPTPLSKKNSSKKIKTRFGTLEIPDGHPLAVCNGGFGISPYLQELMSYAGQDSTFSEASLQLTKYLRVDINHKQVERVSKYIGDQVETLLSAETAQSLPSPSGEHSYCMVDGSMVFTRIEEWKEVKLGRLFSSSDQLDVSPKRTCLESSEYIGHLGDSVAFLEKFEPYVDARQENELVFVSDGAPWIWKWVDERYSASEQILDFYHAKEHLCKVAKLCIKDEQECKQWIGDQEQLLLQDELEAVLQHIKALGAKGKKQNDEKQKLLGYYRRNRKRMRYKTFKEKGLLIGSGAIEAAHRTVVQKRMKLSGQRWTIDGAQKILSLRTAYMSDKWDRVKDIVDGKMAA